MLRNRYLLRLAMIFVVLLLVHTGAQAHQDASNVGFQKLEIPNGNEPALDLGAIGARISIDLRAGGVEQDGLRQARAAALDLVELLALRTENLGEAAHRGGDERVGILDRGELLCLEPVDALCRRYEAETLEQAFLAATGRRIDPTAHDDEREVYA